MQFKNFKYTISCFYRALFCLLLFFILATNLSAAEKSGLSIITISYGDGRVALFWPPSPLFYSGGGWQLEDASSGKIVARWGAAELEQGIASFSVERQRKLRPFLAELRSQKNRKERGSQVAWLLIGAMSDFQAARKLGLGRVLDLVPKGKRSYRLVLLDKNNRPTGKKLISPAIDGWRASSQPEGVVNLRGESSSIGMELYWELSAKPSIPTPVFQVTRTDGNGKEILLTQEPLWLSPELEPGKSAFVDSLAPLETKLTYSVRLQDIFGRLSKPDLVTILNVDLEALKPPEKIKVKPGSNQVEISWLLKENPYTSGYVVERSRRSNGIYEVLTAKGLSRTTDDYLDKTAQGGFTYYYRVRSLGPRGDVGQAPNPVSVMVETAGLPSAPAKLRSEVKPTRVRLFWTPRALPVAGYIVEKKREHDKTWVRLNSSLMTLPQFDDPINLGDFGQRRYRVIAVAFGNQKSRPSDEITVHLPGHPPVPAPFFADIQSEGGGVKLTFHVSKPENSTDSLLIVRGNSGKDLGLVIARDIDSSQTIYEDRRVKPGENYWYALIALDKTGHRSKMSNKLFIVVGASEIPQPHQPRVKFVEKPFRRVRITFDQPQGYLRTAVMRKLVDGPWLTIVGDVAGVNEIVDADPPASGLIQYRIAYLDENHNWGPPSKSITLDLDR